MSGVGTKYIEVVTSQGKRGEKRYINRVLVLQIYGKETAWKP